MVGAEIEDVVSKFNFVGKRVIRSRLASRYMLPLVAIGQKPAIASIPVTFTFYHNCYYDSPNSVDVWIKLDIL